VGKRLVIFGSLVVIAAAFLSTVYLSGLWIPNFPNTTENPVRGLDVSHHQGQIDWNAVAASGIGFAYIKASEGGDLQDANFRKNLNGATRVGLPCGAYHYFTLKTPGLLQAQNFIRTVPRNGMALPPAIDLEVWGNSVEHPSVQKFQSELTIFSEELRKAYGTEPVIYTSSEFLRSYLGNYPVRRLWYRAVLFSPHLLGYDNWNFWQFTEKARVKGVDGFVDMDVFHGTKAEFESWLKPN